LLHAAELAGRIDPSVVNATAEVESIERLVGYPLPNLRKYGYRVNNPSCIEVFRGWNTNDPS